MIGLSIAEDLLHLVPAGLDGKLIPLGKLRAAIAGRRTEIAREAYGRGQTSLAIEHLSRARQIAPRDIGVLYALGQLFFEEKRWGDAAEAFKAIIGVDYSHADAIKGYAYASDNLGRLEEAVYYYVRYLALVDDDPEVHANFVQALEQLGKTAEAIEAGERAKSKFPNDSIFPYLLSQCYYNAGQPKEAGLEITTACEQNPGDADYQRMAGLVYEGLSDLDRAEKALRKAVELEPNDGPTHLLLGNLMDSKGAVNEFVAEAEKARGLIEASDDKSTLVDTYWVLGWAYYKSERWSESRAASERAIELDPSNAVLRFNLGLALLRLGDVTAARDAYRAGAGLGDDTALRHDGIGDLEDLLVSAPDTVGAREILEELKSLPQSTRTSTSAGHRE